jgi:hypothetical protein
MVNAGVDIGAGGDITRPEAGASEPNAPPHDGRGLRIDVAEVVSRACHAAFGRPLVTNILRSMLVEAMIDASLPSEWTWCSADYAGWDFQHTNGLKLEVKQSAARQTWATQAIVASKCAWDIAPRTGYYIGAEWVSAPGRNADLYVLAHHPVVNDRADHRDPQQWRFFVLRTIDLPHVKQISLAAVRRLSSPVSFDDLPNSVEAVRLSVPPR